MILVVIYDIGGVDLAEIRVFYFGFFVLIYDFGYNVILDLK